MSQTPGGSFRYNNNNNEEDRGLYRSGFFKTEAHQQQQQLQQQLPGLTGGEGALGATFAHYRPVQGDTPSRPRSGPNPFTRREYLHRVRRKLAVSAADEAEP